jgi:hypothetical protein
MFYSTGPPPERQVRLKKFYNIHCSIAAYTPLFLISATLNLRVLGNLLRTKERSGLTRLNQLLLHLVLADLSVSFKFFLKKKLRYFKMNSNKYLHHRKFIVTKKNVVKVINC